MSDRKATDGSIGPSNRVAERRDREVRGALNDVLLPDLAKLVRSYDLRPGHRWCSDPIWLPPGVWISEDGRVARLEENSNGFFGLRSANSFATAAHRFTLSGGRCFGIVLLTDLSLGDGHTYPMDYPRERTAYFVPHGGTIMLYGNLPCKFTNDSFIVPRNNNGCGDSIVFDVDLIERQVSVTFNGKQLGPVITDVQDLENCGVYCGLTDDSHRTIGGESLVDCVAMDLQDQ